MARRQEEEANHWPGFVDALSTIVMVVTFLLIILGVVIFIIAQQIQETAGNSKAKSDNKEIYFQSRVPGSTKSKQNATKEDILIAEASIKLASANAKAAASEAKTSAARAQMAKSNAQAEQAKSQAEQAKAQTAQAQAQAAKDNASSQKSLAMAKVAAAQKATAEAELAKEASFTKKSEARIAEAAAAKAMAEAEITKSAALKAEIEKQTEQQQDAMAEIEKLKQEQEHALQNIAKLKLDAELRQDRKTEKTIDGQKVRSEKVDSNKTIAIAGEESAKDFKANIVQSADAVLTLVFDGKSVQIDVNSATQITAFIEKTNLLRDNAKLEIRSYVDLSGTSMGERRRIAFYRAMAARNELLRTGVSAKKISIKVNEVDDASLDRKVKIYVKP